MQLAAINVFRQRTERDKRLLLQSLQVIYLWPSPRLFDVRVKCEKFEGEVMHLVKGNI